MTEYELREKYISVMRGWIGLKKSDNSHKPIIETYNSHKPLARGYPLQLSDDYCAGTVSAAAIKAGMTEIFPLEVSVPKMREIAVNMGIWVENDAYIPATGDLILYDWDDTGKGDNTGSPDHIGAVEKCANGIITVIEGNTSGGKVARRTIAVNARYIRGFITPNYKKLAEPEVKAPEPESEEKNMGELVRYYKLKEIKSKDYRPTIDKLVEKGIIKGRGGEGEDRIIDLTEDSVRLLVFLDRAGVFGE